MSRNVHHVVPGVSGGWNVKRPGTARASKHFDTQADAVSWARELARQAGSELVIHRRDGTIATIDSYVRDPHPQREHRH